MIESKLKLRTSDLCETVHAVSSVYCPHEIRLRESNRGIASELEVRRAGRLPIVSLRYSAPVGIDAGTFRELMLIMSCVDGSAAAIQGRSTAAWHKGQTLPLSPNVESRLDFDRSFMQSSVRIDIETLNAHCARRLNHPLDRPLRFDLRPFSPELESAWQMAVSVALGYEAAGIQLPMAASRNLDEFMLSLMLDLHPHNYTEELHRSSRAAVPRVVREAERMMRESSPDTTVGDIAAAVGISIRSLEAGFREWNQQTPAQYLHGVRLEAARTALSNPDGLTSVTDVALQFGFAHLPRFAQYYRAAFNEHPSQTLRRAKSLLRSSPL